MKNNYKQIKAYCNVCETEKDKTYLGKQESCGVLDDLALYNCTDCKTTSAYKLKNTYFDRNLKEITDKVSYLKGRELSNIKYPMGFDLLGLNYAALPGSIQKLMYNDTKKYIDEKIEQENINNHLESILEHENKQKTIRNNK